MPHTVTGMDNGSCKNMVSNLPLLFAGGYPTSLERITEAQLEKFIPFMVQCSLGYIHIPTLEEYSEPEWWPGDLEFIIPFCRPKAFRGNWLEKMRELVVICYSFHKCVFLLRFCTDLASYEPASLRFINNYNSTTSLYQRHTRKLLVTFRNENMLYDQAQQTSGRKCLLPKQINSQQSDLQHEQMVEPAFFDIYLCDDCDAELYSYDAYVEHEKVCLNRKVVQEDSEDDDVIFCGSEVLPTPKRSDEHIPVYTAQNMSSFLMNFNLFNKNNPLALRKIGSISTSDQNINILKGSPEKLRRLPRRTRGIVTLSKCTSIPLSSPCGQFLLRSSKTVMSIDYQMERLERLERFCFAPALIKDGTLITNRPKWLNTCRLNTNVSVSYKRGSDELEHYHSYKFPRRQLSSACKMRNFQFYNKLLINRCKPCAIKLQRLTAQDIENRNIDIRLQHLNITRACASIQVLPDEPNKTMHVVVDCIDLCSSDDDEPGVSINHNGCIIAVDTTEVERLVGETQKPLPSEIITNTASLKNATDINSSHIASNKTAGHCTFQPLTPSLHLFSSAHNVNPATSPSHAHPSSTNSLLQCSLCISDETNDNDIILSNMENLTEVKENRVNDWLNDAAISTETLTHMPQSHLVITTATPVIKNSGGIAVPKTLPSLMMLARPPSPTSKDILIRQRTATTVDLS
ncbi:uncharacterized protein ova [Ochlerotatus camptorhynchus]|uniref:uncharacterized protein ova n=1 Tax=Ochlerotatus camptorhynchus TaxID=644619 RepID=UPI0031DD86EF